MEIRIDIAPLAPKEEKLQDIADYLDQLKDKFADLVEEYDEEEGDPKEIDALTEALDALEDSYDSINEVLMGEL